MCVSFASMNCNTRLQTTILSARAPAKVSVYDRAFRRWKEFALRGATKAANSGVGEPVFQRHGPWKSVLAKDGYVKDNITSRISVSKSLGL